MNNKFNELIKAVAQPSTWLFGPQKTSSGFRVTFPCFSCCTGRQLITRGTAWLARAGAESRINKANTNNQVRVTWEKKEKEL